MSNSLNLRKMIVDSWLGEEIAEFKKDIIEFFNTTIKFIEGHPAQKMLPMWREIFESPFKRKMVLAARQTGKSTYIGIKILWKLLTEPGKVVNYVTYDEVNLSHYSNEKFRRGLIDANPLIKSQLVKNERGEVAFKNKSTAFFVTDEGEYKHVEGNPLLLAFKQIEQNSAIDMFSDYLKRTLEKKNG